MSNSDFHDPSLDYPPSRPTWRLLVVALAVVAAAVAIMNWTQVSAFAHLGQVETQIEHAVGL